jgi:two-component sensor histidine kinase
MQAEQARIGVLLRQQAAIAEFGSFALRQHDLPTVLLEAARVCAEGLSVPYCKVCRYRTEENDLLVEAGFGWQAGVVGVVVSRADASSPQGRAFISGEPSVCNDLRKDNQFDLPSFYAAHSIVSTVDVIIKGDTRPYGVLEIDNDRQHDYDEHDINFLTSFANVLSEAVATSARTNILRQTLEQMEVLVAVQKRLLDQKRILAEELQHRVRNNMHLVYGMLSRQLIDTSDEMGQRGIRAIQRRITTIAQVYDHLLGNEITRTTDFGVYAASLCRSLAEIQGIPAASVALTCDSDPVILDLDTVTTLGIVLAELVTNSYDHAFPDGIGSIKVSMRGPAEGEVMATMTIVDSGPGFNPQTQNGRHGLGLVRRLVEQVRGTVVLESHRRTLWTIAFPVAA